MIDPERPRGGIAVADKFGGFRLLRYSRLSDRVADDDFATVTGHASGALYRWTRLRRTATIGPDPLAVWAPAPVVSPGFAVTIERCPFLRLAAVGERLAGMAERLSLRASSTRKPFVETVRSSCWIRWRACAARPAGSSVSALEELSAGRDTRWMIKMESVRVQSDQEVVVSRSKVLMVSTSYPASADDWKGVFIRHLTDALARRPDIALKVWCPPGEMPAGVERTMTAEDAEWLSRLMRDGGIAHQMRNGGALGKLRPVGLLLRLRRLYRRASGLDVRHVNWLQNTLPIPHDGVPLLVTVLGSDMKLLQLPGVAWALRRVFSRRRTVIAPNAQWMVPELSERFGRDADVRDVPFGIDPCWYEVRRESFDPMDWVCVSRVTAAKIGHLFNWFQGLVRQGSARLHLFGPMQEQVSLPDWMTYHGPVTAVELRENWFRRACGLITLSQHAEGRPQVMLEAMAAGVPIIASAIPAHVDLLQHRVTGWLCDDVADVEQGVAALSDPEANRQIGSAARRWCRTHIGTWDDCAGRYVDLYGQLTRASS